MYELSEAGGIKAKHRALRLKFACVHATAAALLAFKGVDMFGAKLHPFAHSPNFAQRGTTRGAVGMEEDTTGSGPR
jgi:hypothetical protein